MKPRKQTTKRDHWMSESDKSWSGQMQNWPTHTTGNQLELDHIIQVVQAPKSKTMNL